MPVTEGAAFHDSPRTSGRIEKRVVVVSPGDPDAFLREPASPGKSAAVRPGLPLAFPTPGLVVPPMNSVPDRSAFFAERVREQPENPLFRFSLGQALVNAGRAAEAVGHLRLAAGSRADWMMPRILLGRALHAAGDTTGARAAFSDALSLARAQGHEDPEEELVALIASLG